jgi:putative nucleotidyltransferase with HDIG domain
VSWSERARSVTEDALSDTLPQRWAHVQAVAHRAEALATTLDDNDEADLLVAAAWLHDIGYAPSLAHTRFHPLDGARHVHTLAFPDRVAGLVAHHSAAVVTAQLLGLADELAEFTDEPTPAADLLWYADMTTGPTGADVTADHRIAEIRRRRAADPQAITALDRSLPLRREALQRARHHLDTHQAPTPPPPVR